MKYLLLLIIFILCPFNIKVTSVDGSTDRKATCCGAGKDATLVETEVSKAENDAKERKISKVECDSGGNNEELKYHLEGNKILERNRFVPMKAGWFSIGTDKPFIPQDGEGPARKVYLDEFSINEYEVSNQEFSVFVNQTNYVTEVCSTCL